MRNSLSTSHGAEPPVRTIGLRRLGLGLPALLASLLAACGGGEDSTDDLTKARTAQSIQADVPVQPPGIVATARPARSPQAHAVQLPAPVDEPAAVAKRAQTTDAGMVSVPQRNGIGRSVAQTATGASTRALLQWQAMDGGRHAAALSMRSSQAAGVRLGLLVHALPANATLRVYAQGSATAHEIPAADVLDSLQSNRQAGDTSDAARTWWGPTVIGEEATIEIELPAGVDPATVDVALPRLAHMLALASDSAEIAKAGSGSCQVDVDCSADYDGESASVVRLSYIRDGDSYVCTGTLLADRAGTRIPYVLTANHCVDSQTVASTIETDWYYRSASCNAVAADERRKSLFGGATLLYATGSTDTAFLRLSAQPPAGATYAGWSTAAPALSDAAFNIHHPRGSMQKLATGSVTAYRKCTYKSDNLYCSSGSATQSNFLNVTFGAGTTEAGSSGSAVFVQRGDQRYVVGQLYGGTSSCTNMKGTNVYGRFDLAYAEALHRWLDQGPHSAVYRFFNLLTQAYFYTISRAERDQVIATDPNYVYEGVAFQASTTPQPDTSPVYRFYNHLTLAHFFTISAAERDHVLATDPNYTYEGEAWYAHTSEQANTTQLFRFYNQATGTHFYTADAAERDQVTLTRPSYVYEGVGYYVYGTP